MDFEGPALESLARSARKQIRSRMKALRSAIPPAARARRDKAIIERLMSLEEVVSAKAIALFAPMDDKAEIRLAALDEALRAADKHVYYPRLLVGEGPGMTGELVEAALADLELGPQGFAEPLPHLRGATCGEVDLVVVPALAVAADGHRLGYGAGFYDRVLPAYRPPARAIAVAYDFQLIMELPVLENDVPCDLVVTDVRILRPER